MTGLKGGPTQDEVMAISLQKLGLRKEDRFADLGCGTGKVSIAASSVVGEVYAVDIRPEAIEYARREITASGAKNIRLFEGSAVQFLNQAGDIDVAFLGGSKELPEVLTILKQKGTRKIVVNAVMLSTLNKAVERLKDLGMFEEALQVQVSRSHKIAGSIMFKPIDPVYIIVGGIS